MNYTSEKVLEDDLIKQLIHGESQWTYRPDLKNEDDLWNNIREKIEMNNKAQLNDVPLSDKEFNQIKNQLIFPSFYKAAEWLAGENGVSNVRVVRDDTRLGEVRLMVYSNRDIAGGRSSYEVINQFDTGKGPDMRNRIFDVTLLINGLPMIHIELKNKSNPFMDGFRQIQKYIKENKFTGVFSSTQMFVVSNGTDTRYIAAAKHDNLKAQFLTKWVDKDNKPVNDFLEFAKRVLSIPQAHKMVGQYSVLDHDREAIILLRPYQIHAIEAIQNASREFKSGYVWHTTGSGKTLTSYKVARNLLLMPSMDKTIFVVDRIDLDKQTTNSFMSYAESDVVDIDKTDNVTELINKLKSDDRSVIITTIQKINHVMKRFNLDPDRKYWEKIRNKQIAFVVDECHRAVTPHKQQEIKEFFVSSLWYGFTGTPIFEENKKQEYGNLARTTEEQYGQRLHEYTVKEAIYDKAVLGFQVEYKSTMTDDTLDDHIRNNYKELDPSSMDRIEKEKLIYTEIYHKDSHRLQVIDFIINKSQSKLGLDKGAGQQYSALLTTSSIEDAQAYYKLFKDVIDGRSSVTVSESTKRKVPDFPKVAITYSISENEKDSIRNQEELAIAIKDYNEMFGTRYSLATVGALNSDLNNRLARKKDTYLSRTEQVDIVIVVDRLLTGFDAPTMSTLFIDRAPMQPHNIIQAFSRTNRLYDDRKTYGQIVTFRTPRIWEESVDEALYLYSNGGEDFVQAPSYEESLKMYQEALNELLSISPTFDTVETHEETEKLKKFAKAFQKFDKAFAAIQVYSEYQDEEFSDLTEFTGSLEDYKGRYENIVEELRDRGGKGVKGVDDPDLDIEYELTAITSDEINHNYILRLIQTMLDEQPEVLRKKEDNKKTDEIEEYISTLQRNNPGLGKLIEELWEALQDNTRYFENKDVFVELENLKEQHIYKIINKTAEYYGLEEGDLDFYLRNYVVGRQNQNGENDLFNSRDHQKYEENAIKNGDKPYKRFAYKRNVKQELETLYLNEVEPLYKN